MNDLEKDATKTGAKQETPPRRDHERDTTKSRARYGKVFFEAEPAEQTPPITVLDTPAEALPELDMDLIDVPILTEVVEPEDDRREAPKKSDQ